MSIAGRLVDGPAEIPTQHTFLGCLSLPDVFPPSADGCDLMVRATYYSAEDAQKVRDKALSEFSDHPNDLYRTNIQIGELNALNAALAIIKFKQLRGFYLEEEPNYHVLFEVKDCTIASTSSL